MYVSVLRVHLQLVDEMLVSFLSLKFLPFTFQISVGLDGKKLEPESNVLLASIENMQYAVTLDVLHMVPYFSYKIVSVHSLSALIPSYLLLYLFPFMCGVQVFSAFGPVLKIAMFDKNGGVQALIQYPGQMKISIFFKVCFSTKKLIVACFDDSKYF